MSVRLMHLADVHLGAPLAYLGDKAAQRAGEIESAFVRALKLAPEQGVHALLIAGDLFDSFDPSAELVARVQTAFRAVADAGIPIILIPGTHDSHRYARSVYNRVQFPGADILRDAGKPLHKTLNGLDVYFYGYSGDTNGRGRPEFRRSSNEGLHVALVHGSVMDRGQWPASTRDYPLAPADLEKSGFTYVALGHHHTFREFRHASTVAVYPGTLEGAKFGESGDRYVVIANIDSDGVRIEKIKHNRRTLREITIDLALQGIDSADELVAAIEKHADENAIVRITLTGTAPILPASETIASNVSDRFFHVEVVDETSVYQSRALHSMAGEDTVRGIFVRKVLETIERCDAEERAAAELALRLGIEEFMRVSDENR